MISKKMEAALNKQINNEMYSSYLYLAMAAYCRREGWKGAAAWLGLQAKEEMGHAMKFFKYVEDQGATVTLGGIDKPPADFGTLEDIFTETLKHEQFITKCIHDLTAQSISEKDFATQIQLQWFVTEQVEEESNASEILAKLKMVGKDNRGLFLVDRELGMRAAK